MRVGDCLAQLFIYPRLAKYRACRDNRIIGKASSLSSFSFFSSSLEISNHPYSSWNFLFISQHIIKYFVHEYPNFYHVMSRACENYENFCYCHTNYDGVKYGVHMSLLSNFTKIAFFGWNFVLMIMSMCTCIVCCRFSGSCLCTHSHWD